MNLTITVRHDRDETCNDYTLTRTIEVSTFDATVLQMACRGMMDIWKRSYPFKGRNAHAPVVDVIVDGAGIHVDTAAEFSDRQAA